ncbi:CLUMA_CG003056, isoform A [Clunio marinus]|uniref:CLUMA_CG003056, isoform A n=1 Tax=Clunio marinus TaxID=568069 RepID=A0A1J1HSX6_9DIPT|nr:CLUMA_CG003056, isoform A [Clunio marinus]
MIQIEHHLVTFVERFRISQFKPRVIIIRSHSSEISLLVQLWKLSKSFPNSEYHKWNYFRIGKAILFLMIFSLKQFFVWCGLWLSWPIEPLVM